MLENYFYKLLYFTKYIYIILLEIKNMNSKKSTIEKTFNYFD